MFFAPTLRKLALVLVAGLASVHASAADDLFSDVQIDSVFSTTTTAKKTEESETTTSKRVRSVDHLGRLLRIEGFGFEKVGERTYGAVIELDDWSFPTLVTITEDNKRLGFIAGLVLFDGDETVSNQQLLDLLSANQSVAPYQFGFNKSRKRTELTLAIQNDDVDSGVLAKQIRDLTEVARDTAEIWKRPAKDDEKSSADTEVADSGSQPETSKPQPTAPADKVQPAPEPVLNTSALVGRWSASRSNSEAFALQLTSDGNFTLAYVTADGKTSVSKGTFGIQGGSLSLSISGSTSLSGNIEMKSTDQFEFSPGGGTALLFSRVKS